MPERPGTAKNRTTVRFYGARAVIRALSVLPVPLAERIVARQFAVPQRPRRNRAPSLAGIEPHTFAVSSGRYRVVAWDWARGPTVILVHGWSGHAGQMMHFAPALIARGYNVVAFDLPAHGHSSGRSSTLPDVAQAILDVAHRVSPVTGIIAHSLGASAVALAISQGLAPSATVLLAPPTEPKRFLRAFAMSLGVPEDRLQRVIAEVQKMFSVDLDALDLRKVVLQFHIPALIIHDENDREVPVDNGKALASLWPGARLEITTNLGHHRLLRDPKTISLAVNFLSEARDGKGTRREFRQSAG